MMIRPTLRFSAQYALIDNPKYTAGCSSTIWTTPVAQQIEAECKKQNMAFSYKLGQTNAGRDCLMVYTGDDANRHRDAMGAYMEKRRRQPGESPYQDEMATGLSVFTTAAQQRQFLVMTDYVFDLAGHRDYNSELQQSAPTKPRYPSRKWESTFDVITGERK